MSRLIKLHFKYIYSKLLVYLLLSITSLLFVYFLYEAGIFESYSYRWYNQKELKLNYTTNIILIVKLIFPILSIYLFGNSFLPKEDGYIKIVIKNRNDRIKYFLSKILVIVYISFALFLINFTTINLIGKISIPNYYISKEIVYSFVNIFLMSTILGLISSSLSILLKQSFSYILLIIIYMILQMINDSSNVFLMYMSFIFPVLNNCNSFIFGYLNCFILFFFYFFLSIIIYYVIDL